MTYFGGKAQDGVYQTIINQIPTHDIYIEPFLGGGAIMLKKKLAKYNIAVELHKSAIDQFPKIDGIEILNTCAIEFLRSLTGEKAYSRLKNISSGTVKAKIPCPDPKDVFIYCDPPYPHPSRKSQTRYNFELSDNDHVELLEIIKKLPGSIAISTYPNEIYKELLKDWRLVEFKSMTRGGTQATEYLYMNYPEPKFLHDDRYIGENANNRQDIKRRISRTNKKILKWDSRERIKLMRELFDDIPDDEKKFFRQV